MELRNAERQRHLIRTGDRLRPGPLPADRRAGLLIALLWIARARRSI
jgi:hypothetical protein